MSIKTNFEIPRASDEGDIVKQGQRTAMDLSKNFKSINNYINEQKSIEKSGVYGLNGLEFSQTITVASATFSASITFNHGFNAIPSGFIVTDLFSSVAFGAGGNYSVVRTSWTTNQITVRISGNTASSNFNGTFKILVLR